MLKTAKQIPFKLEITLLQAPVVIGMITEHINTLDNAELLSLPCLMSSQLYSDVSWRIFKKNNVAVESNTKSDFKIKLSPGEAYLLYVFFKDRIPFECNSVLAQLDHYVTSNLHFIDVKTKLSTPQSTCV